MMMIRPSPSNWFVLLLSIEGQVNLVDSGSSASTLPSSSALWFSGLSQCPETQISVTGYQGLIAPASNQEVKIHVKIVLNREIIDGYLYPVGPQHWSPR